MMLVQIVRLAAWGGAKVAVRAVIAVVAVAHVAQWLVGTGRRS